jgi:hypothetical protein
MFSVLSNNVQVATPRQYTRVEPEPVAETGSETARDEGIAFAV